MKQFFVLIALFFSLSTANSQTIKNGVWLNAALLANDRVEIGKASESDRVEAYVLIGYVTGIVAVQSSNSMYALVLANALKDEKDEISLAKIRLALSFSPLIYMPDGLDGRQIFAIIKNYVSNNPKRWNESAYRLVIDALKDAYPTLQN